MSTIDLVSVAKRFGPVTAVDRVDLSVGRGEFVTILGPSGSGKTTLLGLIAGLEAPSAGTIRIGGRDVTGLPPALRNVGLVFQSYALFPHMSVFDNVAFPLTVREVPAAEIRKRVARALERVRLTGHDRRRPSQLSGGQQQRVAIARAIVFEPDILLLDEPLAALDRKLREQVQVELRQLQRELGITALLVTHDQEEALSLSDCIVVLDRGSVQQIGAPEEVYHRPANRFVAEFLGTANLFEGVAEPDGHGGWHLRLPDGTALPCPVPPGGPGPAALVVRPEHLVLDAADATRGLPVRVADAVFLGQSVRLHLTAPDCRTLVALARGGEPCPAVGAVVRVSWRPDDGWLLRDAG